MFLTEPLVTILGYIGLQCTKKRVIFRAKAITLEDYEYINKRYQNYNWCIYDSEYIQSDGVVRIMFYPKRSRIL